MKNTNHYPLLVSNSFDVLMKLELVTCTLGFREISFFPCSIPFPLGPSPPFSCCLALTLRFQQSFSL